MTEAVTKPRAQIDHPAELSRMVRKIVAEVDPIAVYLFDSRARGDGDEDSDYDLMVVVPDDASDEVLRSKWHFSPGNGSVLPDVEIVREWLGQARWHLRGAERLGEEFPETGTFYLQQTAENMTKAALVAHQVRPPSGHGIGEAAARLPATYADRDQFLGLDHLSDFFWAYRYPSPPDTRLPPKPSPQDVQTWTRQIEQLADRFERWLAEREASS